MDFRRPLSVVTPTLDGGVLSVLAAAKEEFSGRRIHRVLGHGSEHGVRKAADRLVEQGIVLRRQAGQAKLYSLNREHVAAPHVEGLASLRIQLIGRLKETIAEWRQPPHFALLFGSVARGEAAPGSDLDLLLVQDMSMDEEDPVWLEQVASLERDATRWTGNDARIVEFTLNELTEGEGQHLLAKALAEGVDLYGSRRVYALSSRI
jgi:predicted nucleotidyltransferase